MGALTSSTMLSVEQQWTGYLVGRLETPMVHCPICNAEASPPAKTGLAGGFDCPNHGRFKVSGDVLDTPAFRDAPRQQWEAALKRAKGLPQIPALPCITSYHF